MPETATVMPLVPDVPVRGRVTAAERINVLHFGPDLGVRGGISAVERLILDHLPERVRARHIATMQEGTVLRKASVFLQAVLQLRRALASTDPLLVHIHFASRGSTLRKLLLARMTLEAGRPLILHAHGGGFDTFYRRLPAPLRRTVTDVFQRASLFVVLSSQWRTFYVRECELSPAQVAVLPNPTRLPQQVPDRRGRSRVQFLYLGRINESKGAFDLLRAFAQLGPELLGRAQLVLAGDGDLHAARRLAQPLGASVRILPWVDAAERDRLLLQSDVFALPSYREGIPMALLEAMASGLPSIVTDVGGIPDVVDDGTEALFVQPGGIEQLRTAMATLIRDEPRRLELGRRARERARQFDIDTYVTKLVGLYQRVAPVTQGRSWS